MNTRESDSKTLLHKAASLGESEIVKTLLDAGADPALLDKELRTPLYLAAEKGHVDVCQMFIKNDKVDINAASKSGKSPLYAAAERGHVQTVRFLLENGANPRQETCRNKIPLYVGAENQNIGVVRELLPYTVEQVKS